MEKLALLKAVLRCQERATLSLSQGETRDLFRVDDVMAILDLIEAMEDLVHQAYMEGHQSGYLSGTGSTPKQDWRDSTACKELQALWRTS